MINLSRVLPFASTCRLPLSSSRRVTARKLHSTSGGRAQVRAPRGNERPLRREEDKSAAEKRIRDQAPSLTNHESRSYVYIYGLFANLFNMYGNRASEKKGVVRHYFDVEDGSRRRLLRIFETAELARPLRRVVLFVDAIRITIRK